MKSILIIVQRSNGDVFLSEPLIRALHTYYPNVTIDLLVNADTIAIAKTLPHIRDIHTYDYGWKKNTKFYRLKHEIALFLSIRGKYDLAINLTASDRSVLYAWVSGRSSISAVEANYSKAWWKRLFLTHSFSVDPQRHILKHNMIPLDILQIPYNSINLQAHYSSKAQKDLLSLPFSIKEPFLIFHPSAQYNYKIYPLHLRNRLLTLLNTLRIPIVVTGGKTPIDEQIASELPSLENLINCIGQTSLEGYIALCNQATAYIGMDTLNMHIASALNKPIFAIFGPTLIKTWSPWSNVLQKHATEPKPIQTYDNITLFMADMPCVPCGKAGCDNRHGKSECLDYIAPETIFNEVARCLNPSASQS